MEIKRVVWAGSCTAGWGCTDASEVTLLTDGFPIALCDDCLEKVVKVAGWDVEKEGEAKPAPAIEWRGEPGHFCGAHDCVFHMHTHVNGKWCVSTVGEVGSDRPYESMVFYVGGNDIDLSELEMAPYNDQEAAQKGHMALVEKYRGMP